METLQVNIGQTRETLTLLRDLIHQQRLALGNGVDQISLESRMATWEDLLSRTQVEILFERSSQLHMLYQVSQSLNSTLNWETTIETVIDAIIQLTGAERGMLIIAENDQFEIKVRRNSTGEPFSEADLQFSRSIVQNAIERGHAILTSNAQVDPRFKGSESIFAYGLRSILCAPLVFQNETLGALYLENRARSGAFSQDNLSTLTAFAAQATMALANARLYAQTNKNLQARLSELSMLQEMVHDLNGTLNYDQVMEQSLKWALIAAKAQSGALGVVAEEGVRWNCIVGDTRPDSRAAVQALRQRTASYHEERLIIPMLREGLPIGVFYLVVNERSFTHSDLELVQRMADHAAIAVENARLYEALRQANQSKSEFISLVSHELRTPMTSVRGYADMLEKGLVGELNSQQREFVESIRRNVERMRVLVSDLLDISRIESGHLRITIQPTAMHATLEEALPSIAESFAERQQTFLQDIPVGLPKVFADSNRIAQVWINLLSNASKYTARGGTITARTWLDPDEPECIRCAITDSGYGISPEDQQHLFTKFFRSDDPSVREQPGTGLGLAIARNLVEMHGGRMWAESTPGQGSTFFFSLPLADPAFQR